MRDGAEAVAWLGRAASRGLAGAQHALGCCLVIGGAGVPRDPLRATALFEAAALQVPGI